MHIFSLAAPTSRKTRTERTPPRATALHLCINIATVSLMIGCTDPRMADQRFNEALLASVKEERDKLKSDISKFIESSHTLKSCEKYADFNQKCNQLRIEVARWGSIVCGSQAKIATLLWAIESGGLGGTAAPGFGACDLRIE